MVGVCKKGVLIGHFLSLDVNDRKICIVDDCYANIEVLHDVAVVIGRTDGQGEGVVHPQEVSSRVFKQIGTN